MMRMKRGGCLKRLVGGALLVSSLGLAGCGTSGDSTVDAPKPLDKMSKEEWCAFYAHYLTTPNLSESAKQADIKQMRAKGCPAV